jgi:hypothetical protein
MPEAIGASRLPVRTADGEAQAPRAPGVMRQARGERRIRLHPAAELRRRGSDDLRCRGVSVSWKRDLISGSGESAWLFSSAAWHHACAPSTEARHLIGHQESCPRFAAPASQHHCSSRLASAGGQSFGVRPAARSSARGSVVSVEGAFCVGLKLTDIVNTWVSGDYGDRACRSPSPLPIVRPTGAWRS